MQIFHFGNEESRTVLIQMVYEHDLRVLDNEVKLIEELSGVSDFHLIAVKVDAWNDDLSPWEAPAVFGDEGFGGQAEKTFCYVSSEVIEPLKSRFGDALRLIIGGYSLAGLFALWSVYQTDSFSGCAAASPSVWFPGFTEYVAGGDILTDRVYLSLGKKEEKTRNPVMSQVGDAVRYIYDRLKADVDVTLEWNEGNHFKEPDLRMAKGFAWCLRAGA